MYLRPHFTRLQNDEPSLDGGGSAATPPAQSGDSGAAGASIDIDKVSDEIGSSLFGPKGEGAESGSGAGAARDANGKFVREPGTGAPSPAPKPDESAAAPAATPAPTAAPVAAPGQAKPVDLTKAPESWRPDAQKEWANLPESARAEIHKREADMFRGLESYKGDAIIGRSMKQITVPLLPHLQAAGLDPVQFYGGLSQMYMQLTNTNTPELERVKFGVELLKRAGIDLTKYDIVGDDPNAAKTVLSEDHPTVKGLRAEIQALQSQITERDRREASTVMGQFTKEVEAFAKDPANEFFDEVVEDIPLLLKGALAEGRQLSLKDAYDMAVRANPTTFAKLQAKLEQAAQEKLKKEQTERAKQVRAATGANVTTGGHSGTPNSETAGSWEDTMQDTLAQIKKR